MLRWVTGTLLVASVLAGLGYYVWQDRRVRELFAPPAARSQEPPLTSLTSQPESVETKPEAPHQPRKSFPRSTTRSDARPSRQEPASRSAQGDDLSNVELARVVMGILRAKGLGSNLNLSIDDDVLSVSGHVETQDAKQEVLDVLENARGRRRLDASQLSVRSAP